LFTQGLHLNIKIYKILIFVFIKYKKGFIMVGALWTGISGLHGQQRALDNESNNIANVNTVGYKSSRISFEDQMYQENIGKGVSSFEVEKLYSQGNLKVTGVSYDMALSGDGFFQLSNGTDYYYSRAGNFRMGENGELQNVGGLMVQGWAMSPLQPDSDVSSTDENVNKFTSDYSKLLGNQILRNSNDVTTKVAKATDYTETAATDSTTIFAGAGQKSAATKIADIEALITEYNTQLTLYANTEPKPASTESSKQRSLIDFDLDNAKLASGDEMYIYIDGTKYSERFDTDEQTTFKNLVDKISNVTGLNAYVTDGADPYDMDTQSKLGKFMIDGIVPGKSFTVSEFGWTDSSNSNAATKGTVEEIQQAVQGTGLTAIANIEDALADAVSGKQRDVFTPADLFEIDSEDGTINGDHSFTFNIEIYDKDAGTTIPIPNDGGDPLTAVPITIDSGAGTALDNNSLTSDAIDRIVTTINTDASLSEQIYARNVNGNLVLETLDKNSTVEFTTSFTKDVTAVAATTNAVAEVQTLEIDDPATATGVLEVTLGNGATINISVPNGATKDEVAAAIFAEASEMKELDDTISSIVYDGADTITFTYEKSAGDIAANVDITNAGGTGVTSTATEVTTGVIGETAAAAIVAEDLAKSATYSGRQGAGAEFLAMTTMINQTATKSDIQLRLDTLELTDSAFGEFSVDDTGLITMKQDGAEFAVGQVAIARFTDNRGLEPIGDNLVEATNRSGQALFNINNEKTAEVSGGTLELSTSDLSTSLVNLMVFQRAFEANSKSITTADQILTTLIQMKSR
jgi:flagellar hook protein FlgE